MTQLLMDVGYGAEDPALMLIHWKFYLRAIINAIIDVLIHTQGMPEDEAMDLMARGGFQEEQEARSKYLRARLTSTQLDLLPGLDRHVGPGAGSAGAGS